MLKQNLLKSTAFAAAVICMLVLSACGGETANENTQQNPSQSAAETQNEQPAPDAAAAEEEAEPTDIAPDTAAEEEPTDTTPVEAEPEPTADAPEVQNNAIVKINGGADDVGIYSIVVRLTDQAADKGVIDMVYYGAKGSPQENSIVNTFRIEYYKEAAGTYEISTFFNGEVYQNQHHKDEVKVTNTFDATLRAGNVIISYTPDGGETQEVFRADADYFR